MSWNMVWRCEQTKKVWRVLDLNILELVWASLMHDEQLSTKILYQLDFIWYMLLEFVSGYARCAMLIHLNIDIRMELQ